MKRKLTSFAIACVLLIGLFPIHAYAFGGFVSPNGSTIYHEIYCDLIEGYSINELRWFDTNEQAEAAGLTPCHECNASEGFDFEYDIETCWKTSDHLIQSAMELEYENGQAHGYEEGYEVGVSDGRTGYEYSIDDYYDLGYDEGYEIGKENGYDYGYDDGVSAGKERAKKELREEYEEEYSQKADQSVTNARIETAVICAIVFGAILYFTRKKKGS